MSACYHQINQKFDYNWECLVQAFWNRYPNPYSLHVLSEDVVHRSVDNKGRLFTKRLLSKTNSAPKWTERFLPSKNVYIVEESMVDLKEGTLTTYTRNIGLRNFMSLEEKVVYHKDNAINASNSNTTSCQRQIWVNSTYGYGLTSAIKRLGIERYKQSMKKTYKGFLWTLEEMFGPRIVTNQNTSLPIPTLNPIFKEKLKQSANKASEFAKSNIPLVIAASESSENMKRST